MARVVITGIGVASPIGHSLDAMSEALRTGRTGVRRVESFGRIKDLRTRLAGAIDDLDLHGRWPRRWARSMGRVAQLAAFASDAAIADARLDADRVQGSDVGLAYGSTHGSSHELERFCRRVFDGDTLEGVPSSSYLRFMSHTTSANLAGLYGIRGRVVSTCAACVSASQAVGAGYEAIKSGAQTIMLCGGSDELHWVPVGVFDILMATSTRFNDDPARTPRPFDKQRDGLVVAEGAGTVVLEEYEHAKARGARIHAEVLGYGTNSDGVHLTTPSEDGMAAAMTRALEDARLSPAAIDYVNAHATATDVGDVVESLATLRVLGPGTPVSSTKGHTGHTLGACGTIEIGLCVAMMRDGFVAPTRNLIDLDPRCAPLNYVQHEPRPARLERVMTNNFAFGGVNTSLILGRVE